MRVLKGLSRIAIVFVLFSLVGCLTLDYLLESSYEAPVEREVEKPVEPPTGNLSIKIVDDKTGEIITRQVTFKLGDKTPVYFSLGTYKFNNLPKGNYSVKASANGYHDYTGTVRVIGGRTEYVNIYMQYKH